MQRKIKIDIDTKTFIRFLAVLCFFAGAVFVFWRLLMIIQLIAISCFLAIALNKPISKLAHSMPRNSRLLATLIVYVLFVLFLYVIFSIALPPTVRQVSVFIDSLPSIIDQLGQKSSVAAELINRYNLQSELSAFAQGIQAQTANYAQGVGSNVVAGLSTVLSGLLTTFLILVITFLLLIEGPNWYDAYWQIYVNEALKSRHQRLVARMYHVVTGYVNGQVFIACIAAGLAALTVLIIALFFGLPLTLALPLGVMTLCCELIPIVGTTVGGAIVIGVLAFNSIGASLAYLIYFLVYMQIEANILQPAIQSRTVEISALTVLIAVISGLFLLGVPGGILAIPVAGCIRVAILDFLDQRHKEHAAIKKLANPVSE